MAKHRPETRLLHAGRDPKSQHGVVNPPVYHASTVIFPTLDALEKASQDPFSGVFYGRLGTPTQFALQDAVADLAGAEGSLAVSSGLAAITVALLSVVKQGAHLLVTDNVYAPTRKFCEGILGSLGVETTYFDPSMGAEVESLVRPETCAIFLESPGSLTFEVQDVPAIAEMAHGHGLTVIMDNTWATPLFFPALKAGVDISVHAATKYIVGHADAMLGMIVANNPHLLNVRRTAVGLGQCAGPDDCYLGLRGLRTLAVRLRRHEANAVALADWLKRQPEVERVLHPALPECPGHAYWERDFRGASGLFGVVLKPSSRKALAAMVDGLELFGMGYSWGGYESLILPTKPQTVRSATEWQTAGPTLRIHAGLDDIEDLKADLEAGFQRLRDAR